MQGAPPQDLADLDLKFHLDHGPCGSVPIAPARIKAVAAICSFDFAAEVSADAICSCQCWCSVPAERQNSVGAPSAYVIELSASRHRGGWPKCGKRVELTVFFVCASALEAKLEANENVLAVESQSKRHDLALRAKEMQGAPPPSQTSISYFTSTMDHADLYL
jgi:hypothetical protein